MDPSTPPAHNLYCYDCGAKLNINEIWEFRPEHDLYDTERENCRRLDEDDSIFVPLCDACYLTEDEEAEEDDEEEESESSYIFYCEGCGEEIDWNITKEEFEQENEPHLCTRCEATDDDYQ